MCVVFFVESRDCSDFPYEEFKTFAAAKSYCKALSKCYPNCEFFVSVAIPDVRFINGLRQE